MAERADLVAALAEALAAWEVWRLDKSLITEWPPAAEICAPVTTVIQAMPVYQAVHGQSLFSGYSGVVIFADRMAIETLHYAAQQTDNAAVRAADWLIGVLNRREAPGVYAVAIWGLSVDGEVEIAPGITIVPFEALPDGHMKRRITDRATQQWNKTVWQSQTYYDRPGAALVRRLNPICYIGNPETPFQQIDEVHYDTRDQLAFLQGSVAGGSLVGASWFEWEDRALDFNLHENWLHWHLPEVVPQVMAHVAVARETLGGVAKKFDALEKPWRRVLLRSMSRFVLSQCRHGFPDRALDLALAFEIAVGGGKGERAPASWKVGVRTAQMIGGNVDARLAIRDTLSTLYDLRSGAAHGGDLKGAEVTKHADTIHASEGIYWDMVAAALEFSKMPDWKLLELEGRK